MSEATQTPNAAAATEDFEFAALAEARNYRRLLLEEFAPFLRGDVLEVGAGIGQNTEELLALAGPATVTALEPDARFAAGFRRRLPGARLLECLTADLPADAAYDAILCVNVLEHIEDDLAELRRQFRLLAAREGHVCLLVPARPELYAAIDRHFGHWRRYRKTELRRSVEEAGFTIVRLRYFNWIGYFAWWLGFKVSGALHFDPGRVRFFDRVLFPWMSRFERGCFAPPFGQSLLVVAQARRAR